MYTFGWNVHGYWFARKDSNTECARYLTPNKDWVQKCINGGYWDNIDDIMEQIRGICGEQCGYIMIEYDMGRVKFDVEPMGPN